MNHANKPIILNKATSAAKGKEFLYDKKPTSKVSKPNIRKGPVKSKPLVIAASESNKLTGLADNPLDKFVAEDKLSGK
jgi:hypothetical protein